MSSALVVAVHAVYFFFFFQAEDGIRDLTVTGVQTCALPISHRSHGGDEREGSEDAVAQHRRDFARLGDTRPRSEEHTSELQSQSNLVCRLLLEKKKKPKCATTKSSLYRATTQCALLLAHAPT